MASILFTIHSQMNEFSKSEKKLGEYILAHSRSVMTMSTEALADAAGVSTASVVRFGKLIVPKGGYPALKLKLSAETDIDQTLYDEINPADSLPAIKSKLAIRVDHTIEQTNLKLADQALRAASQIIKKAKTVYVYGLGASNVVATDFEQKFLRIGKTVIHSQDTHMIAVGISTQKATSALLLISNSGEKSESLQLAKLAKSEKIPVMVLTHNAKSHLGKLGTVILEHDDSAENQTDRSAATTSLLAQLYVIDLLYYTFVTTDYSKHVNQLMNSREAIQKYF